MKYSEVIYCDLIFHLHHSNIYAASLGVLEGENSKLHEEKMTELGEKIASGEKISFASEARWIDTYVQYLVQKIYVYEKFVEHTQKCFSLYEEQKKQPKSKQSFSLYYIDTMRERFDHLDEDRKLIAELIEDRDSLVKMLDEKIAVL
jgi:hypothetical protein